MNDIDNPYASPEAVGAPFVDSIPVGKRGRALRLPYRSAMRLATWLNFLFLVYAIFNLTQGAVAVAELAGVVSSDWGRVNGRFSFPIVESHFVLAVSHSICYFLTGLGFCFWVYRVHSNLPALASRRLRFSSEWAVVWYFIPLASLVMPVEVLKEIWRGSTPGKIYNGDSRLNVPFWLNLWWLTWIISTVGNPVGWWITVGADMEEGIAQADWVIVDISVWNLALTLNSWLFVNAITRNQDAKAAHIAKLLAGGTFQWPTEAAAT